ncbi:MAG: D-alanine--D-alanine ligase [Chitinivibrionales bacterium]|nr:D-alanine--D-alanine ligase [Chitinivibrionales bacterium]
MNVAVVMGGPSAEHDISLLSGQQVISHLNTGSYAVRAVVVSPAKQFYCCDCRDKIPPSDAFSSPDASSCFSGPFHPADSRHVWQDCDIAFLALHGEFGEDGSIQGYLETIGIPYTGSGVFASSLALNKIACKYLYEQNGLATPPWSIFGPRCPENTLDTLEARHGYPCFVKCPQSGSSKLMGKAENRGELQSLLDEYRQHAKAILIESTISGIEFSCPVLERPDGSLDVLPVVEIRPRKSAFFDYEAKYDSGACEELVPAPRSPELLERIQCSARRAHVLLECAGLSRTDIIVAENICYVLETNSIPGLTLNSLVPKAFQARGGTYRELLDLLIHTALAG